MIAEVELLVSRMLLLTLIAIVVMVGVTITNQVNEEAKKCPECDWVVGTGAESDLVAPLLAIFCAGAVAVFVFYT